ncbi:YpiF family protein [Mesobacillus zeae]|uniref:DUF2487 family protein n=1 Tax=Mesobacillus zeae TaxID=1917180 RepID=A0A398AYI6_9BACI|nr:YpiF family protein [Mesobacillus zeae]RID82581.1 DUF2487 family protein [Mesobacillus zeae]
MKWISTDIEMYLKAAEYVDTAIIPLFPVAFGDGMKESSAKTEFSGLLSGLLERQFRGRVILLPGIPYLNGSEDSLILQLEEWEKVLAEGGLKHVFYITSDIGWKQRESRLGGSLLWMPSLPLEHMDEASKMSVLEDQAKQLMPLFARKWEELDGV